jgi:hypothetical protein
MIKSNLKILIFLSKIFSVIEINFLFPDLPDDGPVITGGFPRYHIGDKVTVYSTIKFDNYILKKQSNS